LACGNDNVDVVKLLIENGANYSEHDEILYKKNDIYNYLHHVNNLNKKSSLIYLLQDSIFIIVLFILIVILCFYLYN
jgi:ankyrin repeat protein